MQSLQEEEKKIHNQSRKRIQHLEALHKIPSLADVKYDQWSRVRLDRLLVDHMLRSGYSESAKQLAQERDIEDLVDLGVFTQCQRIVECLRQGETKEALQWCGENKAALKKSQVGDPPHLGILDGITDSFNTAQSGIRTALATVHRAGPVARSNKEDRGHRSCKKIFSHKPRDTK